MASNALEEKINKIRQQNEEIRRRYEEVEEDKKNAAKSNALVQMVPSSDWPERKEPPEFSNLPRVSHKPKPNKEHLEHSHHHYIGAGEGKKLHAFAQGEGPPPDPKYNFLADFERQERTTDDARDNGSGRGRGKNTRGNFKKKGPGREGYHKDQRMHQGMYRDDCPPEYDAWRAERNRIDEDRISRQRTAEGNWRREWDNDKAHILDEAAKRESRSSLGNFIKRDHKEFDRRYHADNNEHSNHNRGNSHRSHQGLVKNYHSNHDHRYNNSYDHGYVSPTTPKPPSSSPGVDDRAVITTDKNLKVTLNQGNLLKGSLMSVKVNSPSIAGTGRVGPRQRTRVTYSGHSDMEGNAQSSAGFLRQKSFEDKSKNVNSNNAQNSHQLRRPYPQKKKENDAKSPYMQKKEFKRDENSQNTYCSPKSPKALKMDVEVSKDDNMHPIEQPNDENKEVASDIYTIVEQQQKDMNEMKDYIVPSESDMCIEPMQKTTDTEISDTQDVDTCNNDCTLDVAQRENDTQKIEHNEVSDREVDETGVVSNAEIDNCTSGEDTMNECNKKYEIDNLNESLNSTIHNTLPCSNIFLSDSLEKNTTAEQYENNNMSLKKSMEATENQMNGNILQQVTELVPDNSSEDTKEQFVENIAASVDESDGAKQAEVGTMAEDTGIPSSTAKTHSVIVDTQQDGNVSRNDKTPLIESVEHEVGANDRGNVEVLSNEMLETKPDDETCLPSLEVEEQHFGRTETVVQLHRDDEVTEKQEMLVIEKKKPDLDTNTKENMKGITEKQSDLNIVSGNKSSVSLAAEIQSVIEIDKQLDCDNEPVETQETQERQDTPVVENETNNNLKDGENAVVDKLSDAVTVESDNKCSLSLTVETNSVIEANNQMNESGDASKAESAILGCKEDPITSACDEKCLETTGNPDKFLSNDKAMSSNKENGAISDNIESQTKCSNISVEIEDNKVKATEFVTEDNKKE